MIKRKGLVRGWSRIAIGAGLTIAGGLLIANLGLVPIPDLVRDVPSVTVDTEQDALRSVVCHGPFGELGTDAANPSFVLPVGSATMVASPGVETQSTLTAEVDAEQAPIAYRSSATPPIAAAQTQRIATSGVVGLAANACLEPANEQWLVGGSTARGNSLSLTLSNPGDVPATVRVTMVDETGEESTSAAGVLVPAGAQRTVSLNGYATGRESPVVHVMSTGSAVSAVMGASQIIDINPVGADHITAQPAPRSELVFPGVINLVDHLHVDEEDHHEDEYPVSVRLYAPDGGSGTAEVVGVTETGERIPLATAEIAQGAVTDTVLELYPEEVTAITVTANVPVVGGVYSSVHVENDHDFAWHTPAPLIEAGETVSTVLLPGGEAMLMNLGTEPAEVTIQETVAQPAAGGDADGGDAAGDDRGDGTESDADGADGESGDESDGAEGDESESDEADAPEPVELPDPTTVTIEPGTAVAVSLPRTAEITSTQPLAGAVSIYPGEALSTYPIVPAPERFSTLRVYTR